MKFTKLPNGANISDYSDEGKPFDWVFSKNTDKKCTICDGQIINQIQINSGCTGICDYRDICEKCGRVV